MKYPSQEIRKARATFTAKLDSILRRLDGCATSDITSVFLRRRSTSAVTVAEVWVVGSYARGAGACGDIDLVVRITGGYATSSAVNNHLLGKLPDVRVYLGTPADNESGIQFPEAVKVWEAGMDWAAAIAAIPENPQAMRFPRKTDGIPLRQEQLRIGVDLAEQVVDAKEDGLLAWTFIPLDALVPAEITDEDFLERLSMFELGSDKRRLLPYIQTYMNSLPGSRSSAPRFDGNFWMQGGTWVLLGSGLPDYDLLNNPSIARMAVMPDLNVRGPNGIWVLERGPAHPLTKVFSQAACVWLLADEGIPHVIQHMGHHEYDYACGIEVFASKDEALAHIAEVYGDDDVEVYGPPPEPMCIAGADYLAALAGVELVDYVNVRSVVAFNWNAAYIGKDLGAHYPGTADIPVWFEAFFAASPAARTIPA